MIDKDKPWFKERRFNYGHEETYEKIYVRKFRGFLLHLLLGHDSMRYLVALVVVMAFLPLGFRTSMIPWWLCFAISAGAYVIRVIGGLWCWRYKKYVVVTDKGIWLLYSSLLNLDTKWSLYSWDEIKLSTDDPYDMRYDGSSKIERFIAKYEFKILDATKTCSLYLNRWDGIEKIHFLDHRDVDEILSYKDLLSQVHKVEYVEWDPTADIDDIDWA